MKALLRIAAAAALALTLGGCETLNAIRQVDQVGVTQKQAYVARSSFVVAQKSATHYLNYCTANRERDLGVCSTSAQRTVVQAVRDGRVARNELRAYMAQCPSTGTCARPTYNKLISVTSTIRGIAANH